jgi:Bacterial SH3 domain
MKKTDALTLWAIAALSVALLAGCTAAYAYRGASKNAGEYKSPRRQTSTRRGLKVRAKYSVSARPKKKTVTGNAKPRKKETGVKRAAVKRDSGAGSKTRAEKGSVRFVCVPKCCIRRAPDARSRAVAELLKYDWVRVLKTRSNWCLVETGAGSVGWLSQNLIN